MKLVIEEPAATGERMANLQLTMAHLGAVMAKRGTVIAEYKAPEAGFPALLMDVDPEDDILTAATILTRELQRLGLTTKPTVHRRHMEPGSRHVALLAMFSMGDFLGFVRPVNPVIIVEGHGLWLAHEALP